MAPGPGTFELCRAVVLAACPERESPAGRRHAPLGRARPCQLASALGATQCRRRHGSNYEMQVIVALLEVIASIVSLVFMAGMVLVPWLVDGAP